MLSQTFVNVSKGLIKECRYDFPLYDGVSVVGFTCQVGDRTIEGIVKEKSKAKEVYDEATSKGETAGLLAQGPTSDVFSTLLGNLPAGVAIQVQVTYIGELRHDVSAECTKFTIPTSISPRYGGMPVYLPGNLANTNGNGMEITVDISMGLGSVIREVRSPSHPIAVRLGSSSVPPSIEAPNLSQASATLSQGGADLDKDFHLEIVNEIAKQPRALLETYSGNTSQRALMVTMVPEVSLASAKPEVIIIADRSGSMQGHKITTLIRVRVFRSSIPFLSPFQRSRTCNGSSLLRRLPEIGNTDSEIVDRRWRSFWDHYQSEFTSTYVLLVLVIACFGKKALSMGRSHSL